MTNNMQVKIGNVSFYKEDIKNSNIIYKDGQKVNCVFLKNGTKIEFKDQDPNANAGVKTGYDAGNQDKYGTGFANITGLTIEGTKENDYYHLSNCENYNIDAKDGNTDEIRIVNGLGNPKNHGTVNADVSDKVNFIDPSKMMSMSEGLFIRKTD